MGLKCSFVNMELGDPETLPAVLVSQVPSVGGRGRSKALRKAVFPKWFFFLLFWLHCMAYKISVPQPGTELRPQQWKHGVLSTSKVP